MPPCAWWRHQMEAFSALLAICAGNSPVLGEFPAQRPVTRGFDVFFDLRPNKRLSKQWWGWWFETPSSPLWRHCNVLTAEYIPIMSELLHVLDAPNPRISEITPPPTAVLSVLTSWPRPFRQKRIGTSIMVSHIRHNSEPILSRKDSPLGVYTWSWLIDISLFVWTY